MAKLRNRSCDYGGYGDNVALPPVIDLSEAWPVS